jgi:hypothetical protein
MEDQIYLALPFLLLLLFWRPRAAMIISCVILVGGIALRAFLAAQDPSVDGGVSFRGFRHGFIIQPGRGWILWWSES